MSMPTFAMTYVVYWPEQGVLKVGRAWRFNRVQMMVASGGHIVVLARGTDWTWEAEALRVLRRWFPRAFRNDAEARELLFMGRGWTECFQVDEHHLQLAVDLCFEGFARGNDQGVNEERATEDQRGGSAVAGVSAGAAGGEADGDRPVAAHGWAGPAGAGAGADRSSDLPRGGGDGSGDRAPAAAGGLGIPDDLQGRRSGVDRTPAAAEGRRSACLVGRPGATSRRFANVRGCGGSAGEGAGAGEGRERRAGGGVGSLVRRAGAHDPAAGTSAADGCPAYRLPGSPARRFRELRTLRHRPTTSRSLGSGGSPPRADDEVRAGAGHRGGLG